MGFFKSKKFIALIIVVVLGIGGFSYFRSRNGEDVETATVERGDIQTELILSGEIIAEEHVKLPFDASGKINWVGVQEGDWVEEGQSLAKRDTVLLYKDLQKAEAAFRAANATRERVHDDVRGHDEDEDFEQREDRTVAEVAQDRAYYDIQKAKKDLAEANLISPITGLVTQVANPFTGVNTLATQAQFEIVNPDSIYLQVSADQTEVIDLFQDQLVTIILDAFDDQEFTGTIDRISFTPNTGDTGTVYNVKVIFQDLNNTDYQYRVGMTGDALFVTEKSAEVLHVPLQFVKEDEEGKYIQLGSPDNKVYIETGIENDEYVEVIGEVGEGDVVFTD